MRRREFTTARMSRTYVFGVFREWLTLSHK